MYKRFLRGGDSGVHTIFGVWMQGNGGIECLGEIPCRSRGRRASTEGIVSFKILQGRLIAVVPGQCDVKRKKIV